MSDFWLRIQRLEQRVLELLARIKALEQRIATLEQNHAARWFK